MDLNQGRVATESPSATMVQYTEGVSWMSYLYLESPRFALHMHSFWVHQLYMPTTTLVL